MVLVLGIFVFTQSNAQNLIPVKKNEFVNQNEKSLQAYDKIKEALSLYEEDSQNANSCLALLSEAYAINKENAELNYNMGLCHLMSDTKEMARDYLLKAYQLDPKVSEDLLFLMGLAHQYEGNFLKAIKMFDQNIENAISAKGSQKRKFIALCEKHISECKNAMLLSSMPVKQNLQLLNGEINSAYNDLNPIESDGMLYFSSQRAGNKKLEKPYYSPMHTKKAKAVPLSFGKEVNLAIVSIPERKSFIFYSGRYGDGDILLVHQKAGKYMPAESLNFINQASSREASACIAGKELYFVSNRKGGYGECDIYYCTKNQDGKWTEARNIGRDINTPYDEGDVFVSPDGKELYFSSKGHNSMGGYDIFKCTRLANGSWGIPENLGAGVNSPYHEIQYFKSKFGKEYMASDRKGGMGGFDIYQIKEIIERPIAENKASETKNVIPQEKPKEIRKYTKELIKEMVPELIYRVQILACKNEASAEQLYQVYKGKSMIEHHKIKGWHKYAIGKFNNYNDAANFRDACGVEGAFVVLFRDDVPLKMSDL
jgi:tetratricopeptide (TPR) repeat protein